MWFSLFQKNQHIFERLSVAWLCSGLFGGNGLQKLDADLSEVFTGLM